MIIGSDIPERIPHKFNNTKTANKTTINSKIQAISQSLGQTIGSKISSNRSIGDALALAQISQSLIQKAIIISSRLKNLASEAISTGKVNTEEVDLAVTDINSSISTYGSEITTPVSTITKTSPNFQPLPEFRMDLENLRDETIKIQNNEKPNIDILDNIFDNLITKSKQIYETTNKIFQSIADSEIKPEIKTDIGSVVADTSGMINTSGAEALVAQGNIIPETLEKLL